MSDLARFILLFATLYLAFGVASPFLPAFLAARGLAPEQVGLVLALSTMIRLVSGPLAGRIADRLRALRVVLAICAALAAAAAVMFLATPQLPALLAVALLHAAALAPTTILSDALALGASVRARGSRLEYGWVRGVGSASFIVGSLAAGQFVEALGPAVVLVAQGALLVLAAGAALGVPDLVRPGDDAAKAAAPHALRALLRNRAFLCVLLIAALVLGSHAMHDAFAMIMWNAAGISPGIASVLWSESVAAEVLVFFGLGPWIVRRFGPSVGMAAGALAALVRWTVMAQTLDPLALAAVEPLHGLSFALLHLACMQVLARVVPPELAATAQAAYAFCIGAVTAALTLMSGTLYAHLGARGFLVMAALALTALPAILALRRAAASDSARESPRSLS
jgi:MFS transporter, PPP family, 3-phenylpropionic acid transporter